MKRRPIKNTTAADGHESRSLAKGLQILETLAVAPAPMQLRDLAESAGLGKASTLRLLRTLQSTGYLVRDQNDCYRLDRDWPYPQQHLLRRLRDAAAPVLNALSAEFGETVALAFLFDDLIRVVDVIESTHYIRMSNYKGGVIQPYASSLGKSITAFQTPERAQKLMSTYGIFHLAPGTITDLRAIQEELAKIREQGYAYDLEETVPGGNCIGAPIYSPTGQAVGALSISMPKDRFTAELRQLLPSKIKECAEQVTKALKLASQPTEKPSRKTVRAAAESPVA